MRGAGPARWAGSPWWDDFYPTCGTPFREKVEIYSHDERPRFCCKQSRFYYERWRFSGGTVRFSWWTVEIFMINGRDFHDERSRFSWWTVDIFIMNGRHFHDEWPRFSWWTVEIFMMNSRDFHNGRSRIVLLLCLKSQNARGASGHPAIRFHPCVSLIYLLDEYFFLLLK